MDRDATIIGYFGATKRGDVVCDGPACIVADPMDEKQFPAMRLVKSGCDFFVRSGSWFWFG
jgi:hypothetical protein